MWNTNIFLTELFGTLVLLFGVMGTTYATKLKSFKWTGFTKHLFVAVGVGMSLAIAVFVGEIEGGNGWVNPAVAVMAAIGKDNYSNLLPALTGEFLGGIVGMLIPLVLIKITSDVTFKEDEVEGFTIKKLVAGEFLGSILFLAGVAVAVFGGSTFKANSGFIVGMAVMIAIAVFGSGNVLLLNPAAGLAMTLAVLIDNKGKGLKMFASLSISTLANLTIAATIGGIMFAFT